MNQTEFADWIDYHMRAYPRLRTWLNEHDGQDEFWRKRLRDVSAESARQATDILHARDEQPKGYADHPRAIYRIAMQESPTPSMIRPVRYVDGVQVYNCGRCQDSGFVSVLSPKTLKALHNNDEAYGLRWCAVACECEVGSQRTRQRWKRPMLQWRDGHVLFTHQIMYDHMLDENDRPIRDDWEACRLLLTDHDERTRATEWVPDQPYPG